MNKHRKLRAIVLAVIVWGSAFYSHGYLTDQQREHLNMNLGCELFEDGSGECHGMVFPGFDEFRN